MTAQEIGRFAWLIGAAALSLGIYATWTMRQYGWGRGTSMVEAIAYPVAVFCALLAALIALCT